MNRGTMYHCAAASATMRLMKLEIYVDMDGVCVDFISAALTVHGLEPEPVFALWAEEFSGEFYPHRVMGISREDFWSKLVPKGEDFWMNLPPYPWYAELFESLETFGRVIYCTSPTRDPACVSGKMRWLQNQHGVAFRDFIFTAHKDRLAHPGAVLIDDYEVNTGSFSRRGGHSILFPQFWNSNAGIEDRLNYVTTQLHHLSDE